MKKNYSLILIFLTLLISGCLPTYIPINIKETARINLQELNSASIGAENKYYLLAKDEKSCAKIPCGKRIILFTHYSNSDGTTHVFCSPRISFIPKRGQEYHANFLIKDDICILSILRKSVNSKLGFIPEPTAE